MKRWRRSLRYLWLRLVRQRDTPERIGRGVGFGLWIAVSPFLGVQTPLVVALCAVFGGNQLAGFLSSWLGTGVLGWCLWPLQLWLGDRMLGITTASGLLRQFVAAPDLAILLALGRAWIIGWLVVTTPLAVAAFVFTCRGVRCWRMRHPVAGGGG